MERPRRILNHLLKANTGSRRTEFRRIRSAPLASLRICLSRMGAIASRVHRQRRSNRSAHRPARQEFPPRRHRCPSETHSNKQKIPLRPSVPVASQSPSHFPLTVNFSETPAPAFVLTVLTTLNLTLLTFPSTCTVRFEHSALYETFPAALLKSFTVQISSALDTESVRSLKTRSGLSKSNARMHLIAVCDWFCLSCCTSYVMVTSYWPGFRSTFPADATDANPLTAAIAANALNVNLVFKQAPVRPDLR